MIRVWEWETVTNEGQTSFIKPHGLPDILDVKRLTLYYDGRKLPSGTYEVDCDGALIVVRGQWPAGLDLLIRYEGAND